MCLFHVLVAFVVAAGASGQEILTMDRLKSINLQSGRMSAKCAVHMQEYLNGLGEGRAWAWNIFDASSKLPYGILTGNTLDLGHYDQCMAVEHVTDSGIIILGKYYLSGIVGILPMDLVSNSWNVSLHHRKQTWSPLLLNSTIGHRATAEEENENLREVGISVCLPNACKPSEVIASLTEVIPLIVANDDNGRITSDTPDFTAADIAFVTFFAVIICLNIVCSIYAFYLQKVGKKPPSLILVAFAGYSHAIKIIQSSNDPNRISCLDGLRVFSLLWVILGHRFSVSVNLPYVNYDYIDDPWKLRTYAFYVQGAPLAVDTFLFLTGLLTAMQFMKSQSRPNAKFNIVLYYIHRYLRLTPALAVVYFLQVTVARHFGEGPLWAAIMEPSRQRCLDAAVPFFLYYQNYLDFNNMCLMHSWYLSMDMQMFILSPIILIPLVKYRSIAIKYLLPACLVLSIVCAFVITYVYETQMFTQEYYDYYYYPMHTRLSAYLVGALAGALMYKYQDAKLKISMVTNLAIWLVVIAGMVACVFTGSDVAYNYNRLSTSFFLAFHRPMWCVGLAWVVLACMKGRGGIFNWVLSRDTFQTLSKFTYSMYLVHATLLIWSVARLRFPGHFHDLGHIHLFLGDIMTVIPAGFIWCILFESPIVILEKIIFGGGGGKGTRKQEPIKSEAVPAEVKIESEKLNS